MLVEEKLGNIRSFEGQGRSIDPINLEWHETGKRIMRKRTRQGRDLVLKFLRESPALEEGDILAEDGATLVVVSILPCEVLVIRPRSLTEVAGICYEIGNKHLPLFLAGDELLVPFEAPLFRQLTAGGYDVSREERQLLHPLKTSVAAHDHGPGGGSLFSKIMQLTNPST